MSRLFFKKNYKILDMKILAERLKEIREEKNITQQEFTEKFEISLRTYQKWETGEREVANYLYKLIKEKVDNEYK